jgi:nucleotide-binding universal stress UspA family protein
VGERNVNVGAGLEQEDLQMRVILAYDASEDAERAADLAAAIKWPSGTNIRVVSVVEPTAMRAPLAAPLTTDVRLDDVIARVLEEQSAAIVRRLQEAGVEASSDVEWGRPATVIAQAARDAAAELIIVGSRGRGGIASLVLGSVSAELIDHAICPVLVARGASLGRVLIASDGSPSSERAVETVATWPIFEAATVRVTSVVDMPRPWSAEAAPEYAQVLDAYGRELEEAQAQHRRLAADAADRLSEAGRRADYEVRTGDAAAEIIEAAHGWPADIVVMGTRGQTGIARLILGSVARNVLLGARSSIMVVPPASRDDS